MEPAVLIAWIGSGLVAGAISTPHCVAMCGPVAAFACGGGRQAAALWYQGGRVLAYGGLGLGAGALGEQALGLLAEPWARAAVAWAFAAVFLTAGIRLFRTRRPGGRARAVDVPIRRLGTPGPLRPLAVGLVSALLPCGALWAAVTLAGATANPVGGAGLMAGFAVASGLGVGLAGWYAARLAPFFREHALVLGSLCVVAAIALAVRPVPMLLAPSQAPSCCEGSAPHAPR